MKRELGIARCGLACCLCSENISCQGCNSGQCPDREWCENRKCSIEKSQTHCYSCSEKRRKVNCVYQRWKTVGLRNVFLLEDRGI